MSETSAENTHTLRQIIDPYAATDASNAVIDAAAAQAFRVDDLGGHVKGRWDWDTIPAEGRRNYRSLVVAALDAAITETERRADPVVPSVLYHWSPVRNRISIQREGLRPGSPSNVFPEWSSPHVCYGETPSAALGLTLIDQPLDLWMVHADRHTFAPANEGREWRSVGPVEAWFVATREGRDPAVDMTAAEQEEADEIVAILHEGEISTPPASTTLGGTQ